VIPAQNSVDIRALIEKLKLSRAFLCTVESCTGGLIANRITDVSGSSEVYWGSFVTYDNSAKEQLGVPRDLVLRHGAVSPEVATLLAEAGLRRMEGALPAGRRISVSTTGIAGPLGGTPEKPVGLCYVAVASSGLATQVRRVQSLPGASREANKNYFSEQALALLQELL
jgi:PncC family amidohydrolase